MGKLEDLLDKYNTLFDEMLICRDKSRMPELERLYIKVSRKVTYIEKTIEDLYIGDKGNAQNVLLSVV